MDRATSAQRGYGARWQKTRAGHLRKHPLCVYCMEQGILTQATVVDHKTPHRGNWAIFWDPDNRQSLCKTHHDSTKQKQEVRNAIIGGDTNGMPLDPNHHWNRQG